MDLQLILIRSSMVVNVPVSGGGARVICAVGAIGREE